MAKCYSYLRFSSKKQEDGDSLRRQTTAAREYAAANQLQYVDAGFSDLGISGWKRSAKRGGLDALLEAVELGKIREGDTIFCENLDRLSRQNFDHTYQLIRQLVSTGVKLHIAADALTLTKDSLTDMVSIIRVAVSSDLAHKESQNKSIRLRETKGAKRQRAISSNEAQARRLPWWIGYDTSTQSYYLNDNAAVVRMIIERRLQGISDRKTATYLNTETTTKAPRGGDWTETSIRKMYRHPAVYGAYQTMTMVDGKAVDGELVLNHYPALIDFEQYQNMAPKGAKPGGQSNHNHLKRLTRCDHCGNALSKRRQMIEGKEYISYQCVGTKAGVCSMPVIKDLHLLVFKMSQHLKQLQPQALQTDQQQIHQQIQQKQHALDEVQEAILAGVGIQALIQTSIRLETEIADLKAKLVLEEAPELYTQLKTLEHDPVQWNYAAVKLIKSVTVKNVNAPTRLGMGKDIGTWKILLDQSNGHQVRLSVFGVGAATLDDTKMLYGNTEQMTEQPLRKPWDL